MKRRLVFIALLIFIALSSYYSFGQNNMLKIKFDLGNNIVETARASGVPKYSTRNVAGMVSYSINQIPANIPAQYTRPGYEITVAPLFAFTMYADEDNQNNLAVTTGVLQISSIESHEAGRALVEQLLAQFKKGKWKRRIRDSCPAVTGRSSLINLAGELNSQQCSIDPDYRLTQEEWLEAMRSGQDYEWIGDGVLAKLSVNYNNDARGITYNIFLEFEDEAIQTERIRKAELEDIKTGEAKGWNTAARIAAGKIKTAAEIKLLEEKALQRGDQLVPR